MILVLLDVILIRLWLINAAIRCSVVEHSATSPWRQGGRKAVGSIARKLNVSSGLLRLSNVLGRWLSNRNPYIGVDRHLRRSNQFLGLACRITPPKYMGILPRS